MIGFRVCLLLFLISLCGFRGRINLYFIDVSGVLRVNLEMGCFFRVILLMYLRVGGNGRNGGFLF